MARAGSGRSKRAAPESASTTSSPAAASEMGRTEPVSPNDEIRIRMYRLGLGDCFLITLRRRDAKAFHIMIDCGVILGTSNSTSRLATALDDIIAETKGSIDVLVVTHEHYDHVAGFVLCEEK